MNLIFNAMPLFWIASYPSRDISLDSSTVTRDVFCENATIDKKASK